MNNKAVPFNEQKFTYLCRLVALRQNQYARMVAQSQASEVDGQEPPNPGDFILNVNQLFHLRYISWD